MAFIDVEYSTGGSVTLTATVLAVKSTTKSFDETVTVPKDGMVSYFANSIGTDPTSSLYLNGTEVTYDYKLTASHTAIMGKLEVHKNDTLRIVSKSASNIGEAELILFSIE